ncbi:MAG TPA: hypothetical protein VKQ72_13000, partial [Aggregatilineales bacterium]|nr:hypothetical protein [Aggregatilineales bacterium]
SEGYDPTTRGSLEAQIANLADELAYSAHDLDDGLRAGLLAPEQPANLEIWRVVKDSIGWDGKNFDDMTRHRLIRRLTRLEITDAIQATDGRLLSTNVQSPEALQSLSENVICNSPTMAHMNDELKDFLYVELYNHYRIMRMTQKAYRFLRDLFEVFVKEPRQLPPEVQGRIEAKGLHRAVADYLAGMTDRYALMEWQRLFDPFSRP